MIDEYMSLILFVIIACCLLLSEQWGLCIEIVIGIEVTSKRPYLSASK